MLKIDKTVKKRWLTSALINIAALLVFYGAIMVGFGFFTVDSQKNNMKSEVATYAKTLYTEYSFETLKEACGEDDVQLVGALSNPNFSYALYMYRDDNSYALLTRDAIIRKNMPPLGANLNKATDETINGYSYITYTLQAGGTGNYLKVFAAVDVLKLTEDYLTKYASVFIVGFAVVSIIMSLIWSYFEIKPIMTNYYKQKNFINDMSHEIRTPLAIIQGNLENAMASPDATVSDVGDMLNTCLGEVEYMKNMSTGLLSIVRGESKTVKTDSKMSDAVSEVIDMYSDSVSVGGKALVACVDNCDIMIDKDKIKQLLTALIENSLKYTREGDRINVKLKNTSEGCVLTVSDTGIGIEKYETEQIFERFYRGENAKNIMGTGLGLSIVKSITESMGGTVKASCNNPSGLEICVTLNKNAI